MSDIEWTDKTVNLAVGCTRVSPGCTNCYAERFVHRGLHEAHRGLTVMRGGRPGWDGKVRFLPERLDEPQQWKRPLRIFINSLSDTFHESLTHTQRAAMFGGFLLAPQHSYQILTKRPEVALDFERWLTAKAEASKLSVRAWLLLAYFSARGIEVSDKECAVVHRIETGPAEHDWWIGVTAEDQKHADERIPHLLSLRVLPTRRFVSYEPAIGPVDFTRWLGQGAEDDDLFQSGGCGLPAGGHRAGDRHEWPRVEDGSAESGPLEGRIASHPMPAAKGRELRRGVPAGAVHGGRDSLPRDGSPTGVQAHLRGHPGPDDREPHQRSEDGQPTVEPGTGYIQRAVNPRSNGSDERTSRSERTPERHGQADSGGRGRDPSATGGRGGPEADCGAVRRVDANGVEGGSRTSLAWIVVGGESGPGARPFDLAWARSVIAQCREAGVSVFCKQLGAEPRGNGHDVRPVRVHTDGRPAESGSRECRLHLRDRKGGDMSEWPEDLRVRQWPEVRRG